MNVRLLKEYVGAALHELKFDTTAYDAAKRSLGAPESTRSASKEEKSEEQKSSEKKEVEIRVAKALGLSAQKDAEKISVIQDIVAKWQSSNSSVTLGDEIIKEAKPYLSYYATKYPDGVPSGTMTKIVKDLNARFEKKIQALKGSGKESDKPAQASWEQVTTNVLDELEKEHNRGKVPQHDRDRKFKDRGFREKLTSFLKSELSSVDRQHMQPHDIRRLAGTIKSRFKDDIARMAPPK